MSTERPGIRHEALLYADPDAFLAGAVPFLRAAMEAGEPALVAVRGDNTALLRAELGPAAAEVGFADIEELGRNPARIIPFWREFVDLHGGRPVRGIGEPIWPGRDAAEIDECQRHEALLNLAFGGAPEWSLLCPYDASSLEDDVLAAVEESHPVVAEGGRSAESAAYRADVDPLAGELPPHPAGAAPMRFGRDGLAELRRRVERAAAGACLAEERARDLVLAASELGANSVLHGGGGGTLWIWEEPGRLIVEVEDRGTIAEPLVGRVRPDLAQLGGRGLWLANQLADLVRIRSGEGGTAVRLQARLSQ